MRSFLPLKSEEPQDRIFRAVIGRAQVQRRDADHPLGRGKIEHGFLNGRIVNGRGGVRLVAEQHRRGEHAKARIDADKKVDRSDIALDIAELDAFDLARDRAELARRIDLHLDAAAGRLLDFFLVEFEELMLPLVHGGAAHFHDEIRGLSRRARRKACEHKTRECKTCERKTRGRSGEKFLGHCPHPDGCAPACAYCDGLPVP